MNNFVARKIITQKNQSLNGTKTFIMYNMGEINYPNFLFVMLDQFLHYFVISKTLSLVNEKWKLEKLNSNHN